MESPWSIPPRTKCDLRFLSLTSPIVQQRSSRRAARQYPRRKPGVTNCSILRPHSGPRGSTRNRGGHCVLVPLDFGSEPGQRLHLWELLLLEVAICRSLQFTLYVPHYPRAPGGGWEVDVGQEVRVLRPRAIATARRKISEWNARHRRHGSVEPEVFFAVAVGTCDHHQLHALGLYCLGCLAPLVANRHRAPGAFIDRARAANARFRRDRAGRYASMRTGLLSSGHSRPS
jgi:hypothetical protein